MTVICHICHLSSQRSSGAGMTVICGPSHYWWTFISGTILKQLLWNRPTFQPDNMPVVSQCPNAVMRNLRTQAKTTSVAYRPQRVCSCYGNLVDNFLSKTSYPTPSFPSCGFQLSHVHCSIKTSLAHTSCTTGGRCTEWSSEKPPRNIFPQVISVCCDGLQSRFSRGDMG